MELQEKRTYPIFKGARVRVHDLRDSTGLNGKVGTVVGFPRPSRGVKWVSVDLDPSQFKGLKRYNAHINPENLERFFDEE
ncbi:MAG: hypothetical protein KGL39_12705 [Patescibacteria group bacterium]|nr:hypothetical protein [Patescibacteria group bacterium]